MQQIPLAIVVGMSVHDQAIGYQNQLLWHVPADLARFKKLTFGHPIIMGRKTFESILAILGKPLPGRTSIVVTRDMNYTYDGVAVAHSLEEAIQLAKAENPTEIHFGGGAELYKQALPLVTNLYVTWYHDQKLGDTFFPDFTDDFAIIAEHPIQEHDGITYQWIDYQRKVSPDKK